MLLINARNKTRKTETQKHEEKKRAERTQHEGPRWRSTEKREKKRLQKGSKELGRLWINDWTILDETHHVTHRGLGSFWWFSPRNYKVNVSRCDIISVEGDGEIVHCTVSLTYKSYKKYEKDAKRDGDLPAIRNRDTARISRLNNSLSSVLSKSVYNHDQGGKTVSFTGSFLAFASSFPLVDFLPPFISLLLLPPLWWAPATSSFSFLVFFLIPVLFPFYDVRFLLLVFFLVFSFTRDRKRPGTPEWSFLVDRTSTGKRFDYVRILSARWFYPPKSSQRLSVDLLHFRSSCCMSIIARDLRDKTEHRLGII